MRFVDSLGSVIHLGCWDRATGLVDGMHGRHFGKGVEMARDKLVSPFIMDVCGTCFGPVGLPSPNADSLDLVGVSGSGPEVACDRQSLWVIYNIPWLD